MCKQDIIYPFINAEGPVWPMFILENNKNTLNISLLTLSWIVMFTFQKK